jgi:hypothetical protein
MYKNLLIVMFGLLNSYHALGAVDVGCRTLDEAWIEITSGNLQLSAKSQPDVISISEPFRLIINICHNNQPYIGNLKFDLRMPKHKHGMNYKANVINQNNGQYLIQGSLLHMPGLWRFSFILDTQTQPLYYKHVLH